MSGPTWRGTLPPPVPPRPGFAGWLLVGLRGACIAALLAGGLGLKLLLRLIERPLFGQRRPLTAWVTQIVSRLVLAVLGLRHEARGPVMTTPGAMVANHSSWLDILVLNARRNLYFVSKSEVAGWPGIGLLARAVGTVFISRDRRAAAEQRAVFERRLLAGHRLLFFPEGTSTDGQRILPFKPTLFAALFSERLRAGSMVQAVSVVYHAPPGADPRFYGWWGDMELGPHLLAVLSARRQGRVEVIYHPPLPASEQRDRKSLAALLEAQVRSAHPLGDAAAAELADASG